MDHEDAAAEVAAIRTAIATSDWATLETYGGLNPALQRMSVLQRRVRRKPPVEGRDHDRATWRSTSVPPDPCRP